MTTTTYRGGIPNVKRTNCRLDSVRIYTAIQQSMNALVLFVKKKNETLHLCIDYRVLNKLSIKNVYLLLLISKMFNKLKRAKFFTKIDLDGTYHQIRINPNDILKMTFNYQLNHYEFMVMHLALPMHSLPFNTS
jgi:hypothetical protein